MLMFNRTPKIDEPTLRKLYSIEKLPMSAIAKQLGVSRVGVWKAIKRYAIPLRPLHRNVVCLACGSTFSVNLKNTTACYCSSPCYHAHRRSISGYSKSWREGQRKARAVAQAKPGQVVHHIDGDNSNNAPDNLQVFNSQAEHIAHHHAVRKSTQA
jgi:hypothetical protein